MVLMTVLIIVSNKLKYKNPQILNYLKNQHTSSLPPTISITSKKELPATQTLYMIYCISWIIFAMFLLLLIV